MYMLFTHDNYVGSTYRGAWHRPAEESEASNPGLMRGKFVLRQRELYVMILPSASMSKSIYTVTLAFRTYNSINRKRVRWSDVKDAITDVGLWGHLIITAIGLTPTNPLGTCKRLIWFSFISPRHLP